MKLVTQTAPTDSPMAMEADMVTRTAMVVVDTVAAAASVEAAAPGCRILERVSRHRHGVSKVRSSSPKYLVRLTAPRSRNASQVREILLPRGSYRSESFRPRSRGLPQGKGNNSSGQECSEAGAHLRRSWVPQLCHERSQATRFCCSHGYPIPRLAYGALWS